MARPPTTDELRDPSLTPRIADSLSRRRTRAGETDRLEGPRFAHEGRSGPTAPLASSPGTVVPVPPGGAGTVLDRYRLERRLGTGGFGTVWLGFDEKLEREVAVKVIAREGADPVPARAEREARVAARLNHPGIVALYEFGADDEAVYLVSELVAGRNLAELQAARALSDRDVARIGVALCEALAHAHGRKVVHRDVKPQNVIVAAEPAAGAGFAKLTDFGVAHLASGDPLTRTGDVVGTLAYMAPEQAEGVRATPAIDVYALALTLYECFTGVNPVRAGGPVATARRLGTLLPSIREHRRDLPQALADTLDRAIDPDPDRRPPLRELRSALADAAADLSERGGLVEPATLRRVGLPASRAHGTRLPRLPLTPIRVALPARLGAGVAAGCLAAVATKLAPPPLHVSAPLLAVAAGLAVAALPRLAWLALAVATCLYLALPPRNLHGIALVALAAALASAILMPRAGPLWSLPAIALVLGLIGVAPAFVAIAGLARTPLRRAGLAAAGAIWVLLVEVTSGRKLLLGAPHGALPRHAWQHTFGTAAQHAIVPLATTAAAVQIVAWAALAALLPLLVRGRSLAGDALGALLWAGALFAAEHAAADAPLPRGALAGAALAGVVAVAATGVRASRDPEGRAVVT